MVRAAALAFKFKKILLSKIKQSSMRSATLFNISLLEEAKTVSIKMVQQKISKTEYQW